MKLGFRFFIPLAGLAVFAANTPAADMLSVSGHLRTRFELNDNTNGVDADYDHMIVSRARLNLDVSPTKTLMVRVTPQFTHNFGNAAGTQAGTFTAYEAWMSWMASDMFSVYVGRQEMNYGMERVLGSDMWNNAIAKGDTHDAVRLVASHAFGKTDFFWAKEEGNGNTLMSDENLWGMYNSLTPGGIPALKSVDLYVIWQQLKTPAVTKTNAWYIGARAAGDMKMVDYDIEVGTLFGDKNKTTTTNTKSQKGMFVDATVGTSPMAKLHSALNATYANTEYSELYAGNGHAKFGKADVINQRNNLMSFALLNSVKLTDKVNFMLDGWWFMKAKADATNVNAGGITTGNSDRNLGFELDAALSYMPEKMLNFELGYDMFKGGETLKTATYGDKVASKFYLQGTVNF